MGFEMIIRNQKIIKFRHDKNFNDEDFFISKSNEHIFKLVNSWPKWEKNFLNIRGERFSGKSHIVNIFLKKNKGVKIKSNSLDNSHLKTIKIHQNIILEDLDKNIDEKLSVKDSAPEAE